jgi:hypothetical protein
MRVGIATIDQSVGIGWRKTNHLIVIAQGMIPVLFTGVSIATGHENGCGLESVKLRVKRLVTKIDCFVITATGLGHPGGLTKLGGERIRSGYPRDRGYWGTLGRKLHGAEGIGIGAGCFTLQLIHAGAGGISLG